MINFNNTQLVVGIGIEFKKFDKKMSYMSRVSFNELRLLRVVCFIVINHNHIFW